MIRENPNAEIPRFWIFLYKIRHFLLSKANVGNFLFRKIQKKVGIISTHYLKIRRKIDRCNNEKAMKIIVENLISKVREMDLCFLFMFNCSAFKMLKCFSIYELTSLSVSYAALFFSWIQTGSSVIAFTIHGPRDRQVSYYIQIISSLSMRLANWLGQVHTY